MLGRDLHHECREPELLFQVERSGVVSAFVESVLRDSHQLRKTGEVYDATLGQRLKQATSRRDSKRPSSGPTSVLTHGLRHLKTPPPSAREPPAGGKTPRCRQRSRPAGHRPHVRYDLASAAR